jgi:hypothetical protein
MFIKNHIVFFYLFSVIPLVAEDVEITGRYQLIIACHETYHEESSVLVEKGKSKFTGKYHSLDIPKSFRKNLRSGMRIKIKGKKKSSVKKKMTKGEVRKAMYKMLNNKEGLALRGKEVVHIMSKIKLMKKVVDKKQQITIGNNKKEKANNGINIVKKNNTPVMISSNQLHDHGELQLQAVSDDDEEVEVTIEAHISVNDIEVVTEEK